MADSQPSGFWEARLLARAARAASLATVAAGQPFASLVIPAFTEDFAAILLLSSLSEHTRHLREEKRCALLLTGTPAEQNPQTAPRLTLTCTAEIVDDPALRQRFLAVHPYAALYADFGDFAFWRLTCGGGLFVGGFARAERLRRADLLPDPDSVAALAGAAERILAHCNADHADTLAEIAGHAGFGSGDWRMVSVDVDGFDISDGSVARRVAWAAPQGDAAGVRAELVRLAREAGVA
jgi:putative heme iron utilization protein